MTKSPFKVVLTGGGTAGHVTPAIEIAKELCRVNSSKIHYIGNENYIEKQIARKNGFPFYHVSSHGMEGKNVLHKWSNFGTKNAKGYLDALKHLKTIKPDFIVSTGGFVTAPVLLAARTLSIPYFIHEQNTVLGRVNKLFANKARKVFLSFSDTLGIEHMTNTIISGNPVSFNTALEPGTDLVVLGGSGGSEFLNNWVLNFSIKNKDINIHLQAGQNNFDEMKRRVDDLKIMNLQVYGFVDINELYSKARLVVSRGGTSCLFELANSAIPSIAVPLPNSMDNHQYYNGKSFEKSGGMIVVEQNQENERKLLTSTTEQWWNDENILSEAHQALISTSYKNCVIKIATDLLEEMPKLKR